MSVNIIIIAAIALIILVIMVVLVLNTGGRIDDTATSCEPNAGVCVLSSEGCPSGTIRNPARSCPDDWGESQICCTQLGG